MASDKAPFRHVLPPPGRLPLRAGTVLAVSLNAALDVTYGVPGLSRNEAVRVRSVHERPGGKAVNVASVLTAMGVESTVTGLVGGHRGLRIEQLLAAAGIAHRFVGVGGESRQTIVAVADDGDFAEYDEPGMDVSEHEWAAYLQEWPPMLDACSSVVIAGSLPAGVPRDAYASLITRARDRARPVVLDTGGEALRAGILARPQLVKINRAELADFAGVSLGDDEAVIHAAQQICLAGVETVIVTLGANGAIALGDGWCDRIRQPPRHGSPVGAGDAFTAGLVALPDEVPRSERLAFAAALAASSIGLTGAGLVDVDLARVLLGEMEVVAL